MNQDQLKASIANLQEAEAPYLTMYFVFREDGEYIIRLVDIDKSVQLDFARKFKTFLDETFSKDNLTVGKITTADDRKYDVLEFDIDIVSPLDKLNSLVSEPDRQKYSHARDKGLKLDGYIFIMGNENAKVSFYKEHYPVDTITREKHILFGRDDSRFVAVPEDEIFKLNNKIDFIQIEGKIYVLNMKVMESNFKIHNVLKKMAEGVIDELNKKKHLENPGYLKDIINSNPAYARKVLRVNKESPVIRLSFADIKVFVQRHPLLKNRLKFNKKETKFNLHSKTSATLYIKLMDDDFLKSDLSKRLYDSITKDRIEYEVEEKRDKPKKK